MEMTNEQTVITYVPGRKKIRLGKVVSNKMNKSIVVAIERQVVHPLYKKYYRWI